MDKKEYHRLYYLKNKEKILEQQKQYYQDNKDKKLEQQKQYYQDNKDKLLEQKYQYKQEHKEEIKQYYQNNRDKILEQAKQYYKTQMGRANNLVNAYRQLDKNANRGECTLTAQWIVDNIFTQPCHWCKKTDWHKLGCDRIDNSLPHTPDNVNPCCEDCNKKRGTKTYEEFLELIKKMG